MINNFTRHIFICALILLLFSCNSTKYLSDDELLLTKNNVISTDKSYDVNGLSDYIVQKPNTKWFSMWKVPLNIYSLSGRDSTKFVNRLLKNWGEAPVVLDTSKIAISASNLKEIAIERGFLDAQVTTEEITKKKRARIIYSITPNETYTIRNITHSIADRKIDSLLQNANVLGVGELRKGQPFSITNLQLERKRITSWLSEHGYRYFNKENITYNIDTCQSEHIVDITTNIGLFRRSSSEELHEHPQYYINKINYTTFDGEKLRIRPQTLDINTVIRAGQLYNEKNIQKTYNKFSRLQFIRNVNISFTESEGSSYKDSSKNALDATVIISQRKPHSIQIQPEGTNTAGDLGAAMSVTYENRNLFHGCETFSLQLRGAFEAIRGLEGYSDNNYVEYGAEAKLTFPELIVPGITRNYKRRHTNFTELIISYNIQNRPEFQRRVLTAGWRYRWHNSSGRVDHVFDLIDLNFVSMPWISDTFKRNYLDSHDSRNAILRYNYEDILITKIGYGIVYKDRRNSLKVNVETSGNLLYSLSNIANFKTNDDGQYKVANVAFAQYAKTDIDYTHLIQFDDKNSLALHTRIGVAVPYGNSNILPYEKRYFSGGANSVRGWSVRELGPGKYKGYDGMIDFINQTGDIRLDLNAEFRSDLFWKFQGAVFIDAGNIWTIRNYKDQPEGEFRINNILDDIAVAYGVGLRLNLGYFILRLDLGMKAINPVYNNKKEHFPIIYPVFHRDYALHFAVGLPF